MIIGLCHSADGNDAGEEWQVLPMLIKSKVDEGSIFGERSKANLLSVNCAKQN